MEFWSLQGHPSYESVRDLQLSLLEQRFEEKIPDTVLFLEHSPVITRGRGLQFTGVARPKHMPFSENLPDGISFCESERGGDLTYHGPGQLVIYPICKLDGTGFAPRHDIGGFLRKLEQIVIDELNDRLNHRMEGRDLFAARKENATGIWIESKKVGSIGVAIRKWVTYHGIALNCTNDLNPFYLISPCGFSPDVMTRLADWVSLGEHWRDKLEHGLAQRMEKGAKVLPLALS